MKPVRKRGWFLNDYELLAKPIKYPKPRIQATIERLVMSFIRILNPRPSEIRRIETRMSDPSVRDDFFEMLMCVLLEANYSDTTLCDSVWVGGMEHRKNFSFLTPEQQTAIYTLDTKTAKCFVNGIDGLDWNDGFDV